MAVKLMSGPGASSAVSGIPANAQSAAYTLALIDAGKSIDIMGAVNITVPTNAAVAFPIGTVVEFCRLAAGVPTIVPASGVTLPCALDVTGASSLLISQQYGAIRLRKTATNQWAAQGTISLPWSPSAVSPSVWYKDGQAGADASSLSPWVDSSTNSRNATQATVGSRPTLRKGISLTGRDVVRFDGVDDYLTSAAFTLSNPCTVFCAVKFVTAVANKRMFDSGNNSNGMGLVLDTTTTFYLNAGGAYCAAVGAAPTVTNWHVYEVLWNNASSELRVDGNVQARAAGDPGTVSGTTGVTLGNIGGGLGAFSNVEIGEFFYVPNVMSTADRVSARQYLKDGWGTP